MSFHHNNDSLIFQYRPLMMDCLSLGNTTSGGLTYILIIRKETLLLSINKSKTIFIFSLPEHFVFLFLY
jgi:hypothetical protein